jgi:hypothetical protein
MVVLLNLRNAWQKVAIRSINGLWDKDKFHCILIEELWFRVCHNPSFRFATKTRLYKSANQIVSPRVTFHAPKSVRKWENEPPHSQMNSHFGSWRPNGLSNLERAIIGVKIHWTKELLISLKSSWNVNVSNGLAWPIWVPKTQVMAKSKAES